MVDDPNFNVNDEFGTSIRVCADPTDPTCQTRVILRQPAVILNQSEIPIPDVAESSVFAASSSYAATASAATSITFVPLTASFATATPYTGLVGTPIGIVSSSLQFNLLTSPFTGSFTGSLTGLANSASLSSGLTGGTTNYIPLWSSATQQSSSAIFQSGGNLGIGTTAPNTRLSVNGSTNVTGSLDVTGAFTAQTKSFKIKHQTQPDKSLVYGVLEGAEHAVYVRGRLQNINTINLPDEWTWLVDENSITVQLTPIGSHQKLYVETIEHNTITIANENLFNKTINCYYIVHATRKDVPPLQTVI